MSVVPKPSSTSNAITTSATDPAPFAESPQSIMSDLLVTIGTTRDVAAFEILFRHFAPRVKAYMARGAGASSVSAEELMQETMVAVWSKAARYDASKGAASTWIFAIARNLRIDAYRRDRRPEFDLNDPAFVTTPDRPADAVIEAREAERSLHEALALLPPEQIALLKLSYFEDASQSAIAEKLDIPLGTVKSRMRLAFIKLRAALASTGDVP